MSSREEARTRADRAAAVLRRLPAPRPSARATGIKVWDLILPRAFMVWSSRGARRAPSSPKSDLQRFPQPRRVSLEGDAVRARRPRGECRVEVEPEPRVEP